MRLKLAARRQRENWEFLFGVSFCDGFFSRFPENGPSGRGFRLAEMEESHEYV